MNRLFCLLLIITIVTSAKAQQPTIHLLDSGHKASIRGLSVVDDTTIWASGSNGLVAKSIDGGKTFTWITVAGYEKRDFRDIEAFDANTAIIIGIAEPAIILKTKDGGAHWYKVFEDSTKGMFLDAMDFDNSGNGVVVGDPIGGDVFYAITHNYGETWVAPTKAEKAIEKGPPIKVVEGEAFFASSGTNVKMLPSTKKQINFIAVTGGTQSKIFQYRCCENRLQMMEGKTSTGANSIALYKNTHAVIVGGDFANDTASALNCNLLQLQKSGTNLQTQLPKVSPHGYRSCVTYLNKKTLITCGTSGVDVSYDGGNTWQFICSLGFHVVQKAKKGRAVFLAGSKGRIAQLHW